MYIFQKEEYITEVKVARVALSNILFGHLMATGFLAMSRLDLHNNWLVRAEIDSEAWYVIYINAYYWGCTTMMTVGFGDILPNTTAEKICTALLQISGCALLGYNISTISELISELRQKREKENRRRQIFRKMIHRDHKSLISKRLEIRILTHIRRSC